MVAARTAATKFSRLEFDEIVVRPAHPAMRAESPNAVAVDPGPPPKMHSGFSAPRPARSPALALTSGNVRKTTSTGSPPFGATAWRRTEDLIFSAREAWSMPYMRRSPPGFLPMTCNWMKYRPPIFRRSCPARIAGVDRSRQAGTRRDRRAGRRVLSRTRRDCFDLARTPPPYALGVPRIALVG